MDILGDSKGVEPYYMDSSTCISMLRVCQDDLVLHDGCSRLVPLERPKLSTASSEVVKPVAKLILREQFYPMTALPRRHLHEDEATYPDNFRDRG